MRSWLAIPALLFSLTSYATVVTFEDVTAIDIGVDCQTLPCDEVITPQGFVFEVSVPADDFSLIGVTAGGPTGNYVAAGYAFPPAGIGRDMIITHQSGLDFDLHSLDTLLFDFDSSLSQGISPLDIYGYDAADNQVAFLSLAPEGDGSDDWVNVVFDSNWDAVNKVVIENQVFGSTFGTEAKPTYVDNFTATVVPLPAAVWLFGSALAGLGWMRRKQAV